MSEKIKNKLKVFISSAMGEETGTTWMSIRKSIKKKLNSCEYIEVFTIEDYATEFPSMQFFSWKVAESDIVIILIKDDIRPGTQQEIEVALEKGKPILVYFMNSDSPEKSVKDFESRIIKRDITTFKNIEESEKIDDIVLNDIMNNIINYYKFEHYLSTEEENKKIFNSEILFEDNILYKQSLSFLEII